MFSLDCLYNMGVDNDTLIYCTTAAGEHWVLGVLCLCLEFCFVNVGIIFGEYWVKGGEVTLG